jgi:hypothetical protein
MLAADAEYGAGLERLRKNSRNTVILSSVLWSEGPAFRVFKPMQVLPSSARKHVLAKAPSRKERKANRRLAFRGLCGLAPWREIVLICSHLPSPRTVSFSPVIDPPLRTPGNIGTVKNR